MQNNGIWKKKKKEKDDALLTDCCHSTLRGLCHNLPVGMQSWTSGQQLVQNLWAVLLRGGSRRPREGGRDSCSASSLHHHVHPFCDSFGVTWLLGQANPLSKKLNYIKPALKIFCQCFNIQRWFGFFFYHSTWKLHVSLKVRNGDLDGCVCWRVVSHHFVA